MNALNRFNKGMSRDIEPDYQPQGTYRSSRNGRVSYKSGQTGAWNNVKGNKLSFKITVGFEVMGIGEFADKLAVISSDGSTTEIGVVEFDGSKVEGVYRVVFTDRLDPFGDKLKNFKKVKVEVQPETKGDTANENKVERIYWTDTSDGPIYSFNLRAEDDLTVSPTAGPYPNSYSVHGMNLHPDFDMGHIQFQKTVPGSILSGQYQYTYRLLNDNGYRTPWTPLTRPVTVTDTGKNIDGNKYRLKKLQAASGKGNRLEVFVNDARYQRLEVAYVYSIDNAAPLEAKIFFNAPIDETTEDTVDGLYDTANIVEHISNTGVSLTPSQLFQETITIESAKTIAIKDNILFPGNITEADTPLLSQATLAGIEIYPTHRYMRSDRTGETGGGSQPPFTYMNPLKRKAFKMNHTRHSDFRIKMKTFTIDNDYENYKGTNIDTEFTGFFRGESYRIGIVLYNKKGQKGFAQHIMDIELPEIETNAQFFEASQFTTTRLDADGKELIEKFTLKRGDEKGHYYALPSSPPSWDTNSPTSYLTDLHEVQTVWPLTYNGDIDYKTPFTEKNFAGYPKIDAATEEADLEHPPPRLKLMNMVMNNLILNDVVDKISGYEIVIAQRDKKLLGQGVVANIIGEGLDNDWRRDRADNKFFPLPTNYYAYRWDGNKGRIRYEDGFRNRNTLFIKPNFYTFTSPDFQIGGQPELLSVDKMKIVGSLYSLWTSQVHVGRHLDQWYSKLYHNLNSGNNFKTGQEHSLEIRVGKNGSSPGTTLVGAELDIKSLTLVAEPGHSVAGYDTDNLAQIFSNANPPVPLNRALDGSGERNIGFDAYFAREIINTAGHRNTTIVHLPGAEVIKPEKPIVGSSTGKPDNNTGLRYALVNYYRTSGGKYGGLSKSALADTVYDSVGEFVSINHTNPTGFLQDVKTDINFGRRTPGYVVDRKEIWGGDCYLDIWNQARNIPHFVYKDDTCAKRDGNSGSHGLIFPVESAFNHMLHRIGDSYAEIGAPVSGTGFFHDGCKSNSEIEDYDNHSLSQHTETLSSVFGLPTDFKPNREFPYRWLWSNKKNYGETIDNYRIFPAANFFDVDGRYGEITASVNIANRMYSFQQKGFSAMSINEQQLLNTDKSTQLILGTGGILSRIDYISREYGTEHPFSLFTSSSSAYFFDALKGKFIMFRGGAVSLLSDDLGLHDFTENNSKLFVGGRGSVYGIFDFKNNEAIWTLVKEEGAGASGFIPPTRPTEGTGDFVDFRDFIGLEGVREDIIPIIPGFGGVPRGSAAARIVVKIKSGRRLDTIGEESTIQSITINGIEQLGSPLDEVNLYTATLNAEVIRDSINNHTPVSGPNYRARIGPNPSASIPANDEANLQIYAPNSLGDTVNSHEIRITFARPPYYSYTTHDVEGGSFPSLDVEFASTIGYNEKLNSWTGFYSFLPDVYAKFGDTVISNRGFTEGLAKNVEELYSHDQGPECNFYGNVYDSKLSFIVNDKSSLTKVFDNMLVKINNQGVGSIVSCRIITNDTDQTINFAGDTRAKLRESFFRFPMRELTNKTRVRGTSVRIEFTFDNTSANGISIDEIRTMYRLSRKN